MDRSWMYGMRNTTDYLKGVEEFCKFASDHQEDTGNDEIYCPCVDCNNVNMFSSVRVIREHLLRRGFREEYKVWVFHGEQCVAREPEIVERYGDLETDVHVHDVDDVGNDECFLDAEVDVEDDVEDEDEAEPEHVSHSQIDGVTNIMDEAVEIDSGGPRIFDALCKAAETALYPNCTKHTKLSAVSALFNLKSKHGWTDVSFTALLEMLDEMLPEKHELPKSTYFAKKLLCPLGLEYQRIHACPNDCVLYRNEYENLHKCPRCGESRYKIIEGEDESIVVRKRPPTKVLWYLPLIPRLRRLFSIKDDAKKLRWHAERTNKDGMLRHPSDSPQWEKIDELFPQFKGDIRNLRLALSTDGMNPFGNLSSQHSTWPVLLSIYNLPPWLCMKQKYIMLSLLISGPKQPGNDIDLYLAPLIEDLLVLWNEGVRVFDAYGKEFFTLRAMIFCTINDFPAYGNLSGYKVKGKKACPICEDDMDSTRLKHSKKDVYLITRRFLHRFHPYRKKKAPFNGEVEDRVARKALSGMEVYRKVQGIETVFGKNGKSKSKESESSLYKKESVFFKLPYWKHLAVRHCLDVMHIEKNVCEAIIGTLLNIPGKTKDGVNVRKDMKMQKIRAKLWPIMSNPTKGKGKTTFLPPACHTLSKKEKRAFCECLYGIKTPTGFSSNIKRIVNLKELKLQGMKSHDCHVLMQVFLPIAIRGILPKYVRNAITRLCSFFHTICSKVIDPEKLDDLQADVIVTLCQFEMYFPPSFFDIMVHLIVHLVREIKLCGPVFLRWAYPYERHMSTLQDKVRNPARPEGSIIQGIVTEEVGEFCAAYLRKSQTIGLPSKSPEERLQGQGIVGAKEIEADEAKHNQAHLYVVQHMAEVQPYLDKHLIELNMKFPRMGERALMQEHNRTFIDWFHKLVIIDVEGANREVSNTIFRLAYGPRNKINTYEGYVINGYTFYTARRDRRSKCVQNSGVAVVASSRDYASARDKSPIDATLPYYGVIQEIWELDYGDFEIPLFQCKWADHRRRGVSRDSSSFTLVDLNRLRDTAEPFILASHAKQCFYVTDPSNKQMSIAIEGKRRILGIGDVVDEEEYDRFDETPPFSIPHDDENEGIDDDPTYMREDHNEGITVIDPK